MEDSVGGGQHRTALAREGQADKIVSGNCQGSFLVRSDLNDAALAAQRSSDVEISPSIEGHALGPAQTTIEGCDRTVGINGIDSVVAGGGWASYKKSTCGRQGQMIRSHAGLQCGKDKHLLVAGDAPDGACAVTNIKV